MDRVRLLKDVYVWHCRAGENSSFTREPRGDTLSETAHVRVVTRCVEQFRNDDMIGEFRKAVGARYKTGAPNLEGVPALAEQRIFARGLDNERASDASESIGEGEDIWDFEDMGTAKKVNTSGISGMLQEV